MRIRFIGLALALIGSGVSAAPRAHSASSGGIAPISISSGPLSCASSVKGIACLGIPYAAAPVGMRRFRAPAPAPRWTVPRDATRFGAACLQPQTAYDRAQGAEDCLYLNVYRPAGAGEALPVIVWLHGGGFMNGSGNAFDGSTLANTAHAIIVTVNYRLGPFGWLALPSLAAEARDGSTGNYGLLDTLAALRWVKGNIAALGGDPDRVTLAGQSAGGEQVLALVSSPYARGLFRRAISMSAPASLPLPTVAASAARRTALLREVGCAEERQQPECLRAVPAGRLLAASHESWNLLKVGGLQWTPTIDDAVLPDQWLARFRSGDFNRVPVMIGHTKHEGRLFQAIYENDVGRAMTEAEFEGVTKAVFHAVSPIVRREYPASAFPTVGARLSQIIVDAQFAAGEQADRAALARFVPVYGYQSCDETAPESHVHAGFSSIGCGHDSDLTYLFQWDDSAHRAPTFTPQQQALATAMGRYWGNFAATGDPNGAGLPRWPAQQVDSDIVQLLEPATTGGIRPTPDGAYSKEHDLTFWHRLMWFGANIKWVGLGVTIALALVIAAILVVRQRGHGAASA